MSQLNVPTFCRISNCYNTQRPTRSAYKTLGHYVPHHNDNNVVVLDSIEVMCSFSLSISSCLHTHFPFLPRPHIERRSAPKVKFSKTVTEFPDYRYSDHTPDETRQTKSSSHSSSPSKSSSSHGSGTSPGQSPSHAPSGHGHHGNRTGLEGESVRVKGEPSEHSSRKSSSEK